MKTSYEILITGDKVTWLGTRPETGRPIRGRVEVDDATASAEATRLGPPTDGRLLAELMRQIAEATGGIKSIPDPMAWQREQRVDRPMPGREP